MIQTKIFLHGQHNYSLITGPTGPLVYGFPLKALDFINRHADTPLDTSTFTKYCMKSPTQEETYILPSKSTAFST